MDTAKTQWFKNFGMTGSHANFYLNISAANITVNKNVLNKSLNNIKKLISENMC